MDHSQNPVQDQFADSSSNPLYYQFSSENPLFGMGIQQPFPALTSPVNAAPSTNIQHMDWNPSMMLDNLTFIEEKIWQVKDAIRSMVDSGSQLSGQPGGLMRQQQLVNSDLTCLIVQLISTAGSLLPSLKNSSFLSQPPAGQMANFAGSSSSSVPSAVFHSEEHKEEMGSPDYEKLFKGFTDGAAEGIDIDNFLVEQRDTKDGKEHGDTKGEDRGDTKDGEECGDADAMDGDNLPPGSYELLQLERDEILAPHTHFCTICGKGFKRDANLRMHMRGHGDEYKSPAALAKPPKDMSTEQNVKRYSCPFAGCKRNRLHSNFQPLKTILCVKNHYKRSHCEKSHTCSRCHAKKFSIMADLKTHEKHCGRVTWLCSCGTSFSRKDKLFAHVALFKVGHTPSLAPADEPAEISDQHLEPAKAASSMAMGSTFMWGSNSTGSDGAPLDIKVLDNCSGDEFLSTANFGSFNFSFGHFDAFPGDASEGSFAMLPAEHYQSVQDKGKS